MTQTNQTTIRTTANLQKFDTDTQIGGFSISAASIINQRDTNEDALGVFTTKDGVLVAAVMDGLGGHPHGEIASHKVLEHLEICIPQLELTKDNFQVEIAEILVEASTLLRAYRDKRDTTITLAAVWPDEIKIAHVGDSIAELLGPDKVHRRTRDQVGGYGWLDHTVESLDPRYIQWHTWPFDNKSKLYLMTDGLDLITTGELHDYTIASQLCEAGTREMDALEKFTRCANSDNCTAIIITHQDYTIDS